MRVTIITFPGSNCDRDVSVAIKKIIGKKLIKNAKYGQPVKNNFFANLKLP